MLISKQLFLISKTLLSDEMLKGKADFQEEFLYIFYIDFMIRII
jgi:hypothetical protein